MNTQKMIDRCLGKNNEEKRTFKCMECEKEFNTNEAHPFNHTQSLCDKCFKFFMNRGLY